MKEVIAVITTVIICIANNQRMLFWIGFQINILKIKVNIVFCYINTEIGILWLSVLQYIDTLIYCDCQYCNILIRWYIIAAALIELSKWLLSMLIVSLIPRLPWEEVSWDWDWLLSCMNLIYPQLCCAVSADGNYCLGGSSGSGSIGSELSVRWPAQLNRQWHACILAIPWN